MSPSYSAESTHCPKPLAVRWQEIAGLTGLYVLCFFYQLNATVSYIGLALAVLSFLPQAKAWLPRFKREALVKIVLALALYIVLYAVWAAREFPETAPTQKSAAQAWLYALLFLPLGWQFQHFRQHLGRLLLALAAGLLLRILLNTDWNDITHIFQWSRTGFGISETVFAPLVGMTCLGWLVLAPRLINASPNPPFQGVKDWSETQASPLPGRFKRAPLPRPVRLGLWLAGLVILLEALVLTQTRGVWLAAALIFPLAIFARYGTFLRSNNLRSVKTLAVVFVVAAIGVGFLKLNSASFITRTQFDLKSVEQLQDRDLASSHARSIGYRLLMWRMGMKLWADRPVFGWGPGTTEMLMRQSGETSLADPQTGGHYYHLHSHYVEILVRFGLVGAVLFALLPALLVAGVWKARALGRLSHDYAVFLLAGWALAAVFVFFDFQLFKFAWRNACLIWLALNAAALFESADSTTLSTENA